MTTQDHHVSDRSVADTKSGPTVPDLSRCPHFAGYDPLAPDELRDPYPSFRHAREEVPVYFSERYGLWEITRQEDVVAVLADLENFSAEAALPMITPPPAVIERMPEYPWTGCVLVQDDPAHRGSRAIIQAPFTPRRVKTRADGIRRKTVELLEPLAREGRMEFITEFAYPLSFAALSNVLGVPTERFELLERGVDATFSLLAGGLTTEEDILAAAQTCADLYEYVYDFIEDRRANPADDFTSVIVNKRTESGGLEPTEQALKHVWTLVIAGFETTANALTNGLRSLLTHRDQWELLLRDRSLLDGAVEEMLRHRTLLKRIFRLARHDVTVGGQTIPAGARVALLVASANHDEHAVEHPDRFDITRRQPHLAFGRGQHFCVGAPLARLEIKIVLEELIDRFPELAAAPEQELTWRPNPMLDEMMTFHVLSGRQ